MPVTFSCPSCQQMISAAVPPATQVQCPLCSQTVTVPQTAPPMLKSVASPVTLPPQHFVGQPQNLGLAVAALVSGILGIVTCPLVGLPAILLGWLALRKIQRDPVRYGGRGMAVAGLCTGGVSLVLALIGSVFLFPIISSAMLDRQERKNRSECAARVRKIADQLFFHAQRDGKFPKNFDVIVAHSELKWADFNCPSDVPDTESYFYVPGYDLLSNTEQIILYENPNIHGGEGGHILTVDNQIEFVYSPEFEERVEAITLPDGTPYAPHED